MGIRNRKVENQGCSIQKHSWLFLEELSRAGAWLVEGGVLEGGVFEGCVLEGCVLEGCVFEG
jgi:hypothetical protein